MDSGKYYVLSAGNNLTESMTKEQILSAITQAVESHTISDVDTGFVEKLKEQNSGSPFKFWAGTTAQYNAITTKQNNCFYILTDDHEKEEIETLIAALSNQVEGMQEKLSDKVLWEGSVNESSEEKTFVVNEIGNYTKFLLEVSRGGSILKTQLVASKHEADGMLDPTEDYDFAIEGFTSVIRSDTSIGFWCCLLGENATNEITFKNAFCKFETNTSKENATLVKIIGIS